MLKTAHDLVQEARKSVDEQAPEAVRQRMAAADTLVIDVREPDEYGQGHLPGAISIPRGMLEFRISSEPALQRTERPLVVYCKTGGRAALATVSLQSMGFGQVVSLAGGYEAWLAAGLPIDKPADIAFD